jgi:hypothetical protein
VDRKYAKFPNLLIAYVWYVEDSAKSVTYATTYREALSVAEAMGYTKTVSWERGLYVVTKPGPDLVGHLKPHLMTPTAWRKKIIGEGQISEITDDGSIQSAPQDN